MQPCYADGTSQTERRGAGEDEKCSASESQQRISRIRATLVEPISRGKQDRLAVSRRVSLSRVLSAFLVASTTTSCLLLQRSGVVDLALGRMSVAIVGLLWFMSTFTEAFWRDTRRACDGMSLLCFLFWSLSHIMWRVVSSEAAGGSASSGSHTGTPSWVWVDVGIAWAMAPMAGGSLQLSLWRSIVPSWLCVTGALAFGLREEEVALDKEAVGGALLLFAAVAVCGVAALAVGYQVLWEQARDARTLMALEDTMSLEDRRRRQTSFSELLLRHLVTDPSLQVLGAGVKELFKDARIFVMHSDALEQIQDGVNLLTDYGDKALKGLKSGASELPAPVLERADMEEILDACLRTTAYLAVSRDHHKVQLDLRVAADVDKNVKTYRLWLSQMTRACLLHALHPDEEETVILRVSYARPGWMRVGIEALWRVAGPAGGGGGVDGAAAPHQEGAKTLSGWDRDMPAGAWWVRAAALALGGEADYDRSNSREGFHELWFTIPAENIPDDELRSRGGTKSAAAADAGVGDSPARADASGVGAAAARALVDGGGSRGDGDIDTKRQTEERDRRGGRNGTTGQTMPLSQSLQSERGERLQAAEAAAAAAGAGRAARRASRRESTLLTTLAPLPSDAGGAPGAGAGVGASVLPRPGGWAASVVLPAPSSAPLGLPSAKKRPSQLPAIRDTEISPGNGRSGQTTLVTAFETEGIAKNGGPSVDPISGNCIAPASLGRGYRSSLGGTLVGGGSTSNHARQHHAPALQGILVSRVESDDDIDDDGGDINGRPSSAPGPARAGSTARSPEVFFRSASRAGSTNAAIDGLSQSAPSSPKSPGLSGTVRKLLGTKDGLAQLRASLRDDDDVDNPEGGTAAAAARAVRAAMGNSSKSIAMSKREAVARAAGQGPAGIAAARLSGALAKNRPSSAPSPAAVSKKASVFGGLVQTLVESNGMSWLGTTKLASPPEPAEEDDGTSHNTEETEESKLEILLVDPQGLVRWVIPRLKERRFSVAVAHSAEEAMEMVQEGSFQVAVVDLHMPRMVGTEFCRKVRVEEAKRAAAVLSSSIGGGEGRRNVGGALEKKDEEGSDGDGDDDDSEEESHSPMKILLHTTSAGSVKSDELEAFLEEGLVEEYAPHPLDFSTLFDFLKLFEEEDGTGKTGPLDDGGADGSASSTLVRSLTSTLNNKMGSLKSTVLVGGEGGENQATAAYDTPGFVGWLFGARSAAPSQPSVEDIASTFFTVKGRSRKAHAAAVGRSPGAGAGGVRGRGGGDNGRNTARSGRISGTADGRGHTRKIAGPWRPGAAPVSPGLGVAEERGG